MIVLTPASACVDEVAGKRVNGGRMDMTYTDKKTSTFRSILTEEFKRELSKILCVQPLFDEPMSLHTTIRVGGPADALVTVLTLDELRKILSLAKEHKIPLFVLGSGSNIIVRDGGVRGVVVKLQGQFSTITINGTKVDSGAGALLKQLVNMTADSGLAGLEQVVGVPGTVGGAIVSNAGTAKEFISERVISVSMVREDGEVIELSKDEISFGYRYSNVLEFGKVIISVSLELERASPEHIRRNIEKLLEQRRMTQPINMPSAGCIFKNPPNECAGKLIEMAGLKGLKHGGAQVSPIHANFVVNAGNATAKDVIELTELMRKVVFEKFGVTLEYEVQIMGED
ncbi:MAG: hypothetical protein HZRFUVUK_000514 [Candidatus Fervidibacterota bacterium]